VDCVVSNCVINLAPDKPAVSRPVAEAACRSTGPADDGLHRRLLELLRRHAVNDYAAGARVFAVKP
jgi:hypothetical protein